MSLAGIQLYSSYTRRIRNADGGWDEATLGVSKVPANATDEDMRYALHAGNHLLDLIAEELNARLVGTSGQKIQRVASLFSEPAPEWAKPDDTPPETPTETLTEAVARITADTPPASLYVGDPDDLPPTIEPVAVAPIDPAPIDPAPVIQQISALPDPDDLDMSIPFANVLGIGIRIPDVTDGRWQEPITEVNRDGTGNGQLMALNAVLTGKGFAKEGRFRACESILNNIDRGDDIRTAIEVTSTRDLSAAQASIVLEWLTQAEETDMARLIADMRERKAKRTGQKALVGDAL